MCLDIFLLPLRPSLFSFFLINLIILCPNQTILAHENVRNIVAGVPADFPPQCSIDKKNEWGSSLRLTFEDVAFNMFKSGFEFSILLQFCFYAPNRAADPTVSVQPKT